MILRVLYPMICDRGTVFHMGTCHATHTLLIMVCKNINLSYILKLV